MTLASSPEAEGRPVLRERASKRQKAQPPACRACDGHGRQLLMHSWFTADGYRSERCPICEGTGENPSGYKDWDGFLAFQRRARANVAAWGGLRPAHVPAPPTRAPQPAPEGARPTDMINDGER